MPIYDYVCHHCGHRFEVIHGLNVDGPTTCPVCHGGPVRKGVVATAVHFKGSGWAKKDRGVARSRSSSTSAEPSATPTANGDSGSGDPKATPTTSGDTASTAAPAATGSPAAE